MKRKELIIDAAAEMFSKKGYRDTSIADLCHQIHVAEGTIFYHFKSKQELFLVILERLTSYIIQEFEKFQSSDRSASGLEQVEALISFFLSLADHMDNRYLLLHRHFSYELAEVNDECRNRLETYYDFILDAFEKPLERGQSDGSIRKLATRKTALLLFALVDGVVRFQTYNLYKSGALYDELMTSCRLVLKPMSPVESIGSDA